MDDLTAKELVVLNNLSQQQSPSVELGTMMQSVIDKLNVVTSGSPVNAVAASKLLTFSGVVKDGETVTITNPALEGSDVYEFLADEAQSKTDEDNIGVDITDYVTFATGTLTILAQPTAGDKMTIGTRVYTFVPLGTDNSDREISIGSDLSTAQECIVDAINGDDGFNTPHPSVIIGDFNGSSVATITALVGGVAGNSIATTELFASGSNVFGNTVLGSGADCSGANARTALLAAITGSGTQGVSGSASGGSAINLIADVAGEAGNDIEVAETLANGSFAASATKLSGGVDGTVGVVGDIHLDSSYLYIATDDNTVADANWRRISLGSAY